MIYCLYKITNNINGMVYVGQTCNVVRRFHRYNVLAARHAKSTMPIVRAICKYGIKRFTFSKLKKFSSRKLVSAAERKAIKYWRSRGLSYNAADGGLGGSYKGHCGHRQKHLTKQWRLNISKGCSGIKHPWSNEAKLRNKGRGKGRKLRVQHRRNISKALRIRWKLFGVVGFGR